MSNNLESLVRPFQDNSSVPSQVYYQPGQLGVQPVILRFGRSGGSGKVLNGGFSSGASHYMKRYENEKRDT